MKIAVDVMAGTVRIEDERPFPLPPVIGQYVVDMPPVEAGVVRLGWDDGETHVEVVDGETEDTQVAQHVQHGRGIIVRGEPGSDTVTSAALLDRSVLEPFVNAWRAAKAKADAAAALERAAITAAAIPTPPNFTR